jgi:S1-C subfamily serine protease
MKISALLFFILLSTSIFSQVEAVEKAISGVVTVVVEKAQPLGKVLLGFRGGVTNEAYERSLNLSNALGSGSGFVIDRNGKKYVVTNAHVIESASDEQGSVFVYSYNRKKYEVKIVGGDSFYDIAVLEFIDNPGAEFSTLEFAAEMPRISQRVYAIGNPLGGYPYTVTDGIVSALNRTRDGLTGKFGFIQSTATVIWGNSGGPLINETGKVVGINSQIGFANGPDGNTYLQQQLNFALEPILSSFLVNEILTKGRFVRSYIGAEFIQSHRIIRTASGYGISSPIQDRPIIHKTIPGTQGAIKLGEYVGWSVLSVNSVEVFGVEDLLGELEKTRPGQKILFTITNNELKKVIEVTSSELTKVSLEEIGKFVLAQNSNISIDYSSANLKINLPSSQGSKSSMMVEKKDMSSATSSVFLLAGGIHNRGYSDIWRITTLADLGALLKIYGLRGGIEYFVSQNPNDTDNVQKIEQNFSTNPQLFQTTLWY